MRVLALDAATEACSVALYSGSESIGRFAVPGRTHAQQILGMVKDVLSEAGLSLSMLDGVAASIGPGAFTGVRISVSVAQGLAFGAGLPVVPVNTLEALALQVLEGTASRAIACLDARMGEVYWGCFAADATRALVAAGVPEVSAPHRVTLPASAGWAGGDAGVVLGIGRGFSAYPDLA